MLPIMEGPLADWYSNMCDTGMLCFTSRSDVCYSLSSIFQSSQFVRRMLLSRWLNIGTANFKIANLLVLFWLMFEHEESKQDGKH